MLRQGKFGPIVVRDNADARLTLLNNQVQGGSYLEPSAAVVDDSLPDDAPGPISLAVYSLGWLMAAVHDPQATAFMVGLGSGAGAAQLLAAFPHVDLTVVEIDPVMVDMALRSYPVLNWYINRGRLNLVVKDALEYLKESPDVFDIGMADSYTGGPTLDEDYLPQLADHSKAVWVNLIDKPDGPKMVDVVCKLDAACKPVADVFSASGSRFPCMPGQRQNWILTTQALDWQRLSSWEFFPELQAYPSVQYMASQWDHLLANATYSE